MEALNFASNVPPPLALALAMTEKHEKQQWAEIMRVQHCSELEAVFAVADALAQRVFTIDKK